jgi:hypothetical protein
MRIVRLKEVAIGQPSTFGLTGCLRTVGGRPTSGPLSPAISSLASRRATAPGSIATTAASIRPLSSTALGWGSNGSDPGLDPSLTAHPAEQPRLRFAEYDELRIIFGDTQEVEDDLLGFRQRLATRFHPLHALPSLSFTLGLRARVLLWSTGSARGRSGSSRSATAVTPVTRGFDRPPT